MPIIVQKYGGSSLASPRHIKEVASLIQKRLEAGVSLCVVVSAMGKNTNQLLDLAHEISPNPVRRELDMLLSCGERASMALLAMALHELGIPSMSLTGSQSGIITDDIHTGAQIIEIRPQRVREGLEQGKVVIIAGFQGVSLNKEITTLGRGGSDTTAVALAAALGADFCEIYSDVAGVYSADPKIVDKPQHIEALSCDEMLCLADSGAKVLNAQAVQFAKLKNIQIKARKTGFEGQETCIGKPAPHPLSEWSGGIKAISYQEKLFCFRFENLEALMKLLKNFLDLGLRPNKIIGTESGYCLIAPEDAHEVPTISRIPDCASISLTGMGVGANMQVLQMMLNELKLLEIPVFGLFSSKLQIYCVVQPIRIHEAVRVLHRRIFG